MRVLVVVLVLLLVSVAITTLLYIGKEVGTPALQVRGLRSGTQYTVRT